jgi:cell division transport system permease protein
MRYILKSTFQSILKEKWINILSALAIASSLLIMAVTFLLVYNFHLATNRLPELFSVVIYLKDNLSREETDKIINQLKQRNDIAGVKYISKADALDDFKKTVKTAKAILEGIDDNPFSSYIELKLKREFVSRSAVENISADIKKIHGVEETYFAERIAETIHFLKKSVHGVGIFLLAIISVVVIFISYSTVKILFYRKQEEIEIMKLLGATNNFIKAPFILEGGMLGLAGGLFAVIEVMIIYMVIKYQLSGMLPVFEGIVLPLPIFPSLILTGCLLGIIGSFIAIGRLRI